MPQADAKDRLPTHEPANGIHCVRTRLRISGTIRQEYSIRLQRQHIFRRSLGWDDSDFASFAAQLSQNVLLDAEVVRHHMKSCRLVLHSDHGNGFMRTLADFPDIRTLG